MVQTTPNGVITPATQKAAVLFMGVIAVGYAINGFNTPMTLLEHAPHMFEFIAGFMLLGAYHYWFQTDIDKSVNGHIASEITKEKKTLEDRIKTLEMRLQLREEMEESLDRRMKAQEEK